jgi:hypothetical protein
LVHFQWNQKKNKREKLDNKREKVKSVCSRELETEGECAFGGYYTGM